MAIETDVKGDCKPAQLNRPFIKRSRSGNVFNTSTTLRSISLKSRVPGDKLIVVTRLNML